MPKTESAIRGPDFTLSAAPRRAAFFTGSSRRSAHSYCVASRNTPANRASSPGPGSTSAAMPTRTRIQPRDSTAMPLEQTFARDHHSSSSEPASLCVPGRGAQGSSLAGRTTISSSPRASSVTVGSK